MAVGCLVTVFFAAGFLVTVGLSSRAVMRVTFVVLVLLVAGFFAFAAKVVALPN